MHTLGQETGEGHGDVLHLHFLSHSIANALPVTLIQDDLDVLYLNPVRIDLPCSDAKLATITLIFAFHP